MKTARSAESDGQKLSRRRKEGKKTGSDAQSNRSLKREERTNREAAETLDQSAPPSVVSFNAAIVSY